LRIENTPGVTMQNFYVRGGLSLPSFCCA
jgi:hypothetical protein